ncbi:MAG: four helix bundle protein [Candidatus Mcinerneyibacterium aminivorans]|uniref:Four helix bundle protein n=1 Tax=Candidatus Mcinerneyibacterium aminivorans TaxID=2703815 RepID=A0A5D0MFQ9_9BACT|nr:MAG: four helix bundle protein [Candidatus Mcinerneyibacterium aminivorans]
MYSENSVLYEKAFRFSISAIKLCKKLQSNNEYVMSKQLLKSSTSIGANIKESKYAQSKKDFISKLNISLKEAGETEYWLELLHETKYISKEKASKLLKDLRELIKMLVSSVKTAKYNLRKEKK